MYEDQSVIYEFIFEEIAKFWNPFLVIRQFYFVGFAN